MIFYNKILNSDKIFFITLIIFFFTLIYFFTCNDDDFKGLDKKNYNNNPLERFINLFYFSCVTSSTIGYGDIHPFTTKTKLIAIIQILFIIILTFI